MPVALVEHLEFFRRPGIFEALKKALRALHHALPAIRHHGPMLVRRQAGQREVIVILLPVAQIHIEIILLENPLRILAAEHIVAPCPFLDIAAHLELAVRRQAGGFLVSGNARRDRVAQRDDVFHIRPQHGVEKCALVSRLGRLFGHDHIIAIQARIGKIQLHHRQIFRHVVRHQRMGVGAFPEIKRPGIGKSIVRQRVRCIVRIETQRLKQLLGQI